MYLNKIEQSYISASLIVSPDDWKLPKLLENPTDNTKLYLTFAKSSKLTSLFSWDNNTLVLAELGQKIVLLNHDKKLIEYFVQYEFSHFRKIKTITQIALWANHAFPMPNLEGLSAIKWTFFKYLLPKADAIVADTMQTELGKRFWLRRIRDAWDTGLKTYLVLRDTNMVFEIKNTKDLDTLTPYIWGTKDRHKYRRAFITKKELFPKTTDIQTFLQK